MQNSTEHVVQQLHTIEVVSSQPKKNTAMAPGNVTVESHAAEFPAQRINGFYGSMVNAFGSCLGTFGMIPCCICCPNPYKTIDQGTIGLVTRFGRYYKTVDPGLIRLNPYTEAVLKVDMRVQISNIPNQVIMTKDNVNVHIDSIIYWHIIDPYQASYGISDVRQALIERTQTTLRQVLGARLLQEIIENREQLAHEIQTIIDIPAHAWGVTVESILIKDIKFSKSLQESLSSAAQAKRLAESKVIQAQSEVDSAKLMRQAAEFLNTPAAMQIRYLESMANMARHSGQKTIFMPTSDDVKTHFHASSGAAGESGPSGFSMPSVSVAGPSGLLRLSVVILMVTASHAGRSLKDFVSDPQVQLVAPHLIQHINALGIELTSSQYKDTSYSIPSGTQVPLLSDIVEIVSQTVFAPKDSKERDWSRLEAAKIKAIQTHGEQAVVASANLTDIDTHRASLIINTIYDTVIIIPASSKATYSANAVKAQSSSIWDIIGFGLIKSSDAVRNVKSFVSPQGGGCETSDNAYLRGVEEVVYYSSLIDGLAGSTMATAPSDSAVKSLGLGTIIASIGKLAIEIHMAQSVARLANLNLFDEHVRAMVYMALAAESPLSDSAKTAREIFSMKSQGLANKIPDVALKSLEQQAAWVLITKGAGHVQGQNVFPNVPVVRNIFAFSSDVLSANHVGDVLKYVFCPGQANEPLAFSDNDGSTPSASTRAELEAQNANRREDDDDEDDDENAENGDETNSKPASMRSTKLKGQKAFNDPADSEKKDTHKKAAEEQKREL
ncbi:hypothetical protein BGZ98_006169 [Dissophora globulifera]|nr:hypothetical protein BGZ98_006169 [Dissophora globulifera]